MNTANITLLELIVAATILAILTMMALPLARITIQREWEKQLRRAVSRCYSREGPCQVGKLVAELNEFQDRTDAAQKGS